MDNNINKDERRNARAQVIASYLQYIAAKEDEEYDKYELKDILKLLDDDWI